MKKLISILLVLSMLLSSLAMAAGSEVVISNMRYSDNGGSALDFSGIEIKLASAEKADMSGASLAVSADGNDILRAVVSADELGAYFSATGISDVYSIPAEMLQEIVGAPFNEGGNDQLAVLAVGLLERVTGIVTEGVQSTGTYDHDGVIYDTYTIDVSHEQFMELVDILDELIALYPEFITVEASGYASLREMFEGEGIKVRYDGDILSAKDEVMIDLFGYANEEAIVNIYLDVSTGYDEASGCDVENIYIGFFDTTEENYGKELSYIYASIYTEEETGDLRTAKLSFGAGEDRSDDIYAAISIKDNTGIGMDYFTFGTMDNSFDLMVMWGETYGVFNVNANMTDTGLDTEVIIGYTLKDGKGAFDLDARAGADEISITADVAVSEDEGAWLPEIGETVNIAEAGENQMNKLMMEAMGLFGRLISGLSAANEDFARLMSVLMQQ